MAVDSEAEGSRGAGTAAACERRREATRARSTEALEREREGAMVSGEGGGRREEGGGRREEGRARRSFPLKMGGG